MAITRQGNFLGQQRVDVPDLRAIESGVANDFDLLAGTIIGDQRALVVRGFTIDTATAFGNPAQALVLRTAGGIVAHWGATEAGTMLAVESSRADEVLNTANPRVLGGFASGVVNYIGIDYRRQADASTSDVTKFLTADTNQEVVRSVPKARTLDYRIVITTSPFSLTSNVCPVAKVVTDTNGNVVSVTDARNMLGRLAPGGDVPNPFGSYAWGQRRENNYVYSPPSVDSPFEGGDKALGSLKSWMDAMMSVVWEAKSGQYWYSPTTRDGIKLCCTADIIASAGDNFDWTSPPTLLYKGLAVTFENSDVYYNTIVDNDVTGVTLLDGQCLYVDLDRTQTAALVAQVGDLDDLPPPAVPGSRVIIAWVLNSELFIRDRGFDITRTVPVATTARTGIVRLFQTSGAPSEPVVLNLNINNSITWTASGNQRALTVSGDGTSEGVRATGGATDGAGVLGFGQGAGSGIGGQGGSAGGTGVKGVGGASGGIGGEFTAGTNGVGVYAEGGAGAAGYGIWAIGGNNAPGVVAEGVGTGSGIIASGGGGGGFGGRFDALGGNNYGILTQGHGSGAGLYGIGGATANTPGIIGAGGGSGTLGATTSSVGAPGVLGAGRAGGPGVLGCGGTTDGAPGVLGLAGGSTGSLGSTTTALATPGVWGVGRSTGPGVLGHGGAAGGAGLQGVGGAGAASVGVLGQSGTTAGSVGVLGQGYGPNGVGVQGIGSLSGGHAITATAYGGAGVLATSESFVGVSGSSLTNDGGYFQSGGSGQAGARGVGSTGAYGVIASNTDATRAPFRIVPSGEPSTGLVGDLYVTTGGVLMICSSISPLTWTPVGVGS